MTIHNLDPVQLLVMHAPDGGQDPTSGEHRRPGGAVAIDAQRILNATISPAHATPNAPGPLPTTPIWHNSLRTTVSPDRTPPLLSLALLFPTPPSPSSVATPRFSCGRRTSSRIHQTMFCQTAM
ncbi:hypothetical protein ONZ51_g4167 [Trametes cubensis]|uniref:Uncharacterized protein n=1 Tax=Trametes cubensis TaxID=1111947 RepID=A0AAD7XEY6_9APHY|nr:hypothetical protein ONZ51_g4167 [Trametes cubensis]